MNNLSYKKYNLPKPIKIYSKIKKKNMTLFVVMIYEQHKGSPMQLTYKTILIKRCKKLLKLQE